MCEGKDGNAGRYEESHNMVFQPQYAQCFTATSLPKTYDYNLQYQNISSVKYSKQITVNSQTVSDALSNQSSDLLDFARQNCNEERIF